MYIYSFYYIQILFVINIPIGSKKLLRNIWFQKMLKISENQVIIWPRVLFMTFTHIIINTLCYHSVVDWGALSFYRENLWWVSGCFLLWNCTMWGTVSYIANFWYFVFFLHINCNSFSNFTCHNFLRWTSVIFVFFPIR